MRQWVIHVIFGQVNRRLLFPNRDNRNDIASSREVTIVSVRGREDDTATTPHSASLHTRAGLAVVDQRIEARVQPG